MRMRLTDILLQGVELTKGPIIIYLKCVSLAVPCSYRGREFLHIPVAGSYIARVLGEFST